MPRFKVAHLREQGQRHTYVPLESSFEHKLDSVQQDVIEELQVRANNAGLRGSVVVVWEYGGKMRFIAPRPWHPFFQGLHLGLVMANINRELSW